MAINALRSIIKLPEGSFYDQGKNISFIPNVIGYTIFWKDTEIYISFFLLYLLFTGVGQAMRYIGAPGSLTYLHIELDGYPSVNLLLAGGPKLWLIMHPADANKYSNLISKSLREKGGCPARAVHRPGYFLMIRELERLRINYCFMLQEAGDLVFVGGDVPHQVLNLDFNLADARLILTPNLKLQNRRLDCRCEDSVGYLPPHAHSLPPGASVIFPPVGELVDRYEENSESLKENQDIVGSSVPVSDSLFCFLIICLLF